MPSTRLSWTSCSSAVRSSGISPSVCGAALVDERLVGEQIRDAAEGGLFPDRQLERRDAGAELRPQLLERALEAGALTVELVHEDHARHPEVGSDLPDHLRLHFHAVDCAHDEHREVGHSQRREDVADEVGVTRRVDEVHLVAIPLERRQGEREAEVALLLFRVEIGDSGAVLDTPRPTDRTGPQQQGLGQRRLAGSRMADQRDVADLGRRIGLQRTPSSASARAPPSRWERSVVAIHVHPIRRTRWYPDRVPFPGASMFDGRWRTSFERGLQPVGANIRRTGITADHLTAFGLLTAVGASIAIASGALRGGLLLVILAAVPDLLDGAVAKASGTALASRRVLRLGQRPDHRLAATRWRRLVSRLGQRRPRGDPAARCPRDVGTDLLRAGEGRVARVRRPWRRHGAAPSGSSSCASACCSTHSSSRCSGSCWCSPPSPPSSGS